jgi:hypothetical protein
MRDEREPKAPGVTMRIVLELSAESETVSGTLTTDEGSRRFWGWLELMSALELATGATAASAVTPADQLARIRHPGDRKSEHHAAQRDPSRGGDHRHP